MNLDLIDMISERHIQLRSKLQQLWDEEDGAIKLSNSEWFVMSLVAQAQLTIPHAAKRLDISRQAAHKLIRSLEAKGLIEIRNINKKVKTAQFTELGLQYNERYKELKAEIERAIAKSIGQDKLQWLYEVLRSDWDSFI